jgi:predicted metalloprotease with PDZ domain
MNFTKFWHLTAFRTAAAVLFLVSMAAATSAAPTVSYRVVLEAAGDDAVHVEMRIRGVEGATLDVAMPAWTPGSYEILNYARDVSDLFAYGENDKPLARRRVDKQTWRIECAGQSAVTVKYVVTCARLDVDSNWLGENYGQLNGAATFLYVVNRRDAPASVEFALPKDWKVATALPENGPNRFEAKSYDALIDAPAMVGKFSRMDFSVQGKPFAVVTTRPSKNPAGLRAAIAKIAETYSALMGGLPFERYMFFYIPFEDEEDEDKLEGLEHADSTLINYSPEELIDDPTSVTFLSITAHEFFHAWNVKRLRPRELASASPEREAYTPSLWFAEGVTEYYAWLGLLRAKLVGPEAFADALQTALTKLANSPGRKSVSLEDASVMTWLTGTSGFEDIPLDYYGKGMVVALMLDVEIRSRTGGARGLDDVMREMFRKFPEKGDGYAAEDIVATVNQVAGADLTEMFRRYVSGTDEPPYREYLARIGMNSLAEPITMIETGYDVARVDGVGLQVQEVEPGSPADEAGLEEGDVVKSVNGRPVRSETEFEVANDSVKADVPVKIAIVRDGAPQTLTLTPIMVTAIDVAVGFAPNPTPEQLKLRNGIFQSVQAKAAGM